MIPVGAKTLAVLYTPDGRVAAGWPVALLDQACGATEVAADGTFRVVCSAASRTRAYAFDAAGRVLKGWPVDIPGSAEAMLVVDPVVGETRLSVLVIDDLATIPGTASVATVDAVGRVSRGTPVAFPDWTGWWALGPDGTAYYAHYEGSDEDGLLSKTVLRAFDTAGVRAGWPLAVPGILSSPAFEPDGRVRLVRGHMPASGTGMVATTATRGGDVSSRTSVGDVPTVGGRR